MWIRPEHQPTHRSLCLADSVDVDSLLARSPVLPDAIMILPSHSPPFAPSSRSPSPVPSL
eukprot:2512812-Rhodomonas_salina.2